MLMTLTLPLGQLGFLTGRPLPLPQYRAGQAEVTLLSHPRVWICAGGLCQQPCQERSHDEAFVFSLQYVRGHGQ